MIILRAEKRSEDHGMLFFLHAEKRSEDHGMLFCQS
jgi:hypothetical protein